MGSRGRAEDDGGVIVKTREQAVRVPEIVALRREVQAAYAAMVELQKRQWGQSGTPGASSDTVRQTSRAIADADAHHRVLTDAYEAHVALEMVGGNQRVAASLLGISDDALRGRLAKAGWDAERLRERWPLSDRQRGKKGDWCHEQKLIPRVRRGGKNGRRDRSPRDFSW